MRIWTDEQISLLKEYYPTCDRVEDIVNIIGMTVSQMYTKAYILKLKRESNVGHKNFLKGGATRFKKGNVPYNKGIKGLTGANKTSFKRGNTPHNTKHFGKPYLHKRTRKNGYIERVWLIQPLGTCKRQVYTRYLWEQENGKLPKGSIITFKDGFIEDRLPVLNDLKLIDRAKNLNNNTGVIDCTEEYARRMLKIPDAPKELVKLKQQQLKLNRKVNEVLIHG